MISFGFFPFGFILPLIFFVIIARVASGFVRSAHRRHTISHDRFDDELVALEDRSRRRPVVDEARIFKLAYRLKGRLTVSDIVVETGLSVHEAEELIESMVDSTRVRMEIDERGIVTYEFPEIIRRFEGQ